ncbi:MarR family winged helix-turn-helix transcriptional regulator [Streptomyces sp. PSAA01]|uniref:MarR family winged helix-turn-helix transcriptional regulator n=1 Tax=Streptomyces sp. PSAA01 TaxID=2912762 RepID=UPI001F25CE04|nr:MarR family winged helix-turn-helix transcriptional regulator [Streptomyces sp. PSAA01]MCG0286055.1 MarR family winged helix-turn-helix transcriptional regulator [Streptomyces sp. PSAA01]
MATQRHYEELARQLSAIGTVKRGLGRVLPTDCPSGAAIVLMLLDRYGEMRMSKLAELLDIDMSVTSRHVAHVADRGWVDRKPDPLDRRSRLLSINASGRTLLGEVSGRYTDALANCLSDWSDEDVDHLNELLDRLRTSFGDTRSRPVPQQAESSITRTPSQR